MAEELRDFTTLGSELAKQMGWCAIDCWNLNAWHAGIASATASTADAMLLQETKLEGDEACRRAEDAMRGKGWNAKLNRAVKTTDGGVSAGVAIMTKRHIGMDPSANDFIKARYRSRISCAWVGTAKKGGFYLLSVYLWTSEGMSQRNAELLDEIERVTKLLRAPWVLGGDLNMNPQSLEDWAKRVRATIRCTTAPTCHSNNYDYFITHRSMADAVVGTQLITDLGGRPHYGTRLLITAKDTDDLVWTLKKPRQIPSRLPSGCKQHVPSYSESKNLIGKPTKERISNALKQWYDMAESEFMDMMSLSAEEAVPFTGRSDGARFVQKPISSRAPAQWANLYEAAERWHKIAAWATTILRAKKLTNCPLGLSSHANVLKHKLLDQQTWRQKSAERPDRIHQ